MLSSPRRMFVVGFAVLLAVGCGPKQAGEAELTSEGGMETRGDGPTDGSSSESELVTSGQCMGDPGTTTGGGEGAADAGETMGPALCPDQPAIAGCCCFDDIASGLLFPYGKVVCEVHRICQEILLRDEHEPYFDEPITSCPSAIDCALAALIAGTPGTISWSTGGGEFGEGVAVHIIGDGTAIASGFYAADLNAGVLPVERRNLASKDYFMGCAAKGSALDRFACVKEPFTGEVLETCVEGFDFGI